MSKPRVRFAPSPTGSPHIGNIRTAVFDYLFAERTGGTFVLRIEDTDQSRFVPGSLEEMMADLRWLGIEWDEGPEVGGDYGPYFQSERLGIYKQYADQLLAEGKAYRCYCTKERLEELRVEQEAKKQPVGYDRRCRDLSETERARLAADNPNPVIRFKMNLEGRTEFYDEVRGEIGFENELLDDLIMIKADGYPTYNFANIVDDHLMEITHVIRGEEFISSTPKHIQMYEAFGWTPPLWITAPLILDENRRKLAKRSDTQTRFTAYIEDGYLPDAMLNFLATMGWSAGEDRKLYSREELVAKFSVEGITNHPAVFDLAKLNDLQGEYVRMMDVEELADRILPWMQKAGYVSESLGEDERTYLREITALIRDRLVVLAEAPEMTVFFYRDEFDFEQKGVQKHLAKDTTPALLNAVIENLKVAPEWTLDYVEAAVREAGARLDMEGGRVIHPVRMAITGRTYGPGLFELMSVIGRDRCIARLAKAAETEWAG